MPTQTFTCLDQKDDLKGEYSIITNIKLTLVSLKTP